MVCISLGTRAPTKATRFAACLSFTGIRPKPRIAAFGCAGSLEPMGCVPTPVRIESTRVRYEAATLTRVRGGRHPQSTTIGFARTKSLLLDLEQDQTVVRN